MPQHHHFCFLLPPRSCSIAHMRMRHRILIALAAVPTVAVAISLLSRDSEPQYQGCKLSEWLPQTAGVPSEADEAIRQIGTNALPCLLKWIAYEPSPIRNFAFYRLTRISPALAHPLSDFPMRNRAAEAEYAFLILGPAARGAVPELARLAINAKDLQASIRCVGALRSVGPDSVPGLTAIISNPNAKPRFLAINCLQQFGTKSLSAIPALLNCLNDKSPIIVSAAAEALGTLALEPTIVIPALTATLQSTNAQCRAGAVRGLGNFTNASALAAPPLRRALRDQDPLVRIEAANALWCVTGEIQTNEPTP